MTRLRSFLASLLLLVALSTTAHAQSAVGVWDATVEAGGSHSSVLTLTEQGGALGGTFGASAGQGAALQNVKLEGNALSFDFETPDYGKMSVKVVLDGDTFSGTLGMSMGEFPLVGKRQAAAAPAAPKFSTKSLVGDLLANPQAKAVLDKHVPGMTTHPQIGDASSLSLIELATYAGDALTEQVLKAIDEDLSKL